MKIFYTQGFLFNTKALQSGVCLYLPCTSIFTSHISMLKSHM